MNKRIVCRSCRGTRA